VTFHRKTVKRAFWAGLLREILAYSTDCMQGSVANACIVRNKLGV
jgi:hypothetical protein